MQSTEWFLSALFLTVSGALPLCFLCPQAYQGPASCRLPGSPGARGCSLSWPPGSASAARSLAHPPPRCLSVPSMDHGRTRSRRHSLGTGQWQQGTPGTKPLCHGLPTAGPPKVPPFPLCPHPDWFLPGVSGDALSQTAPRGSWPHHLQQDGRGWSPRDPSDGGSKGPASKATRRHWPAACPGPPQPAASPESASPPPSVLREQKATHRSRGRAGNTGEIKLGLLPLCK